MDIDGLFYSSLKPYVLLVHALVEWLFAICYLDIQALVTAWHTLHCLACIWEFCLWVDKTFLSNGVAGSEVHGDVMVGENSPQFLKQTCYISNGNVVWFVIQFLPSWYLTFFFLCIFVDFWWGEMSSETLKSPCSFFKLLRVPWMDDWEPTQTSSSILHNIQNSLCCICSGKSDESIYIQNNHHV